jgi:hypothetical protein
LYLEQGVVVEVFVGAVVVVVVGDSPPATTHPPAAPGPGLELGPADVVVDLLALAGARFGPEPVARSTAAAPAAVASRPAAIFVARDRPGRGGLQQGGGLKSNRVVSRSSAVIVRRLLGRQVACGRRSPVPYMSRRWALLGSLGRLAAVQWGSPTTRERLFWDYFFCLA